MVKYSNLKSIILNTLDSNKALDIVAINLEGKSSIADFMIIASGTSSRHIQSLSEQVLEEFKNQGRITKYIESGMWDNITPENDKIMICGSMAFNTSMKEILLQKGYSEGNKRSEGSFTLEKAFVGE